MVKSCGSRGVRSVVFRFILKVEFIGIIDRLFIFASFVIVKVWK